MKYTPFALPLLLIGSAVFGATFPQDFTLSWTNSAQYIDGTPIEPGDLVSVRVSCTRNNQPWLDEVIPVNGEGQPQSQTWASQVTQPGNYECVAFSVVIDGTESDASNQTLKKWIGKPVPPQGVAE